MLTRDGYRWIGLHGNNCKIQCDPTEFNRQGTDFCKFELSHKSLTNPNQNLLFKLLHGYNMLGNLHIWEHPPSQYKIRQA